LHFSFQLTETSTKFLQIMRNQFASITLSAAANGFWWRVLFSRGGQRM
jgi:hypothetical protein